MRDIKNKAYGYTEVEQLVREATCNDATFPSEMLMKEIARSTFTRDFSGIMAIVWKRLKDKTSTHHPYKCLVLLDFLLREGNHELIMQQVGRRAPPHLDAHGTDFTLSPHAHVPRSALTTCRDAPPALRSRITSTSSRRSPPSVASTSIRWTLGVWCASGHRRFYAHSTVVAAVATPPAAIPPPTPTALAMVAGAATRRLRIGRRAAMAVVAASAAAAAATASAAAAVAAAAMAATASAAATMRGRRRSNGTRTTARPTVAASAAAAPAAAASLPSRSAMRPSGAHRRRLSS